MAYIRSLFICEELLLFFFFQRKRTSLFSFFRLHDRKMCVLGLCALIDMEQIPQVLNQVSGQILPAFILLFNGLKRAYACHAEHENDSEDDDEAEDDDETGKGFAVEEASLLYCLARNITGPNFSPLLKKSYHS